MDIHLWHEAPILASSSSGSLAVGLVALALAGLCALIGIPCVRWKQHLVVRVIMRICGIVSLLAALLTFSAVASGGDWIFVAIPVVLGILMLLLARLPARRPGASE